MFFAGSGFAVVGIWSGLVFGIIPIFGGPVGDVQMHKGSYTSALVVTKLEEKSAEYKCRETTA